MSWARTLLTGSTTVLFVGALLVGWFVPNDRYDVLAVLLVAVVLTLWALLGRIARLQRGADLNTAFRRHQEDIAQAFQHPGFDYELGQLLEPTDDEPTRPVPALAHYATVE